ncbi:MAG: beta strand repeat-containing protein, partial [Gemmatimonadaceae bacterium]
TGFFNGGTQTGGADVAEAFEVEGHVDHYRPGDVLVISRRSDRKVSRSAEPYSSRVIGVYATKPGVLLTERAIDDSLDDMIPVGVIGVIPTRVSVENGAINRGDILVTATPGHAMRSSPLDVQGITLYPSGSILGKALENFAGPGTGVIRVLVNVK